VKDALVVDGPWKDLWEHTPIGGVEIGDHDTRIDPLGLEFEQKQVDGVVVVLGIDLEGQDIIGVDVDGKVGIALHSAATRAVGWDLGRGADLDPLVVDTDDAAGTDDAEIGSEGGSRGGERSDPAVESSRGYGKHTCAATIAREQNLVNLDRDQACVKGMRRVREDARGKVSKGLVGAVRVVTVVA
jgi:hypothetical protein